MLCASSLRGASPAQHLPPLVHAPVARGRCFRQMTRAAPTTHPTAAAPATWTREKEDIVVQKLLSHKALHKWWQCAQKYM